MAAPHLQINQTDLSVFMRVAHEDGLDPADSDYSEPQFSGSPAFSEGAGYVGDAVGNREMVFPLFLSAESEADLHQLIRDINSELTRGASVEYASSADGEVTYFDLERGRLEVEYRYWISRAVRTRAMLRLWTKPYGHTGTTRVAATLAATHSIGQVSIGPIAGDVHAQANLKVAMATLAGEDLYRVIGAFGLRYPVASGYSPALDSGGLASTMLTTASVFGASGRTASQYVGVALSTTHLQNSKTFMSLPLRIQDAGRYRLLGLMTATVTVPSGAATAPKLTAAKDGGDLIGSVDLSSDDVISRYGWVDFGEYTVTPSLVNQTVVISYVGHPSAAAGATYPIRFDHLLSLPVDQSAGLLVFDNNQTADSITNGETWSYLGIGETRCVLSSASGTLRSDLTKLVRGAPLTIPPVPSGLPSGAAQLTVVMTAVKGKLNPGPANNAFSVTVEVRERFQFLR